MNQKRLQEKQLIWGSEEYNTQLLYFTSSSLSADDSKIYMICEVRQLSQNTEGCLKSYVYFNGNPEKGLGKASVCLDAERDIVYYIQGNDICKVGLDERIQILNQIPSGQITARIPIKRTENIYPYRKWTGRKRKLPGFLFAGMSPTGLGRMLTPTPYITIKEIRCISLQETRQK